MTKEQWQKQHITLCSDNCLYCPRYLAKTNEELRRVSELWYKIGWRDTIVSTDEICCSGCSSHKQCTYHLVDCVKEHGVTKCNQCSRFPCEKVDDMLKRSADYKKKCQEVCSEEEYEMLKKSFFNKEENLKL